MEKSHTPMRFAAPALMCLAMVTAARNDDEANPNTGSAANGDDNRRDNRRNDDRNSSPTYGIIAAIVLLVASISM